MRFTNDGWIWRGQEDYTPGYWISVYHSSSYEHQRILFFDSSGILITFGFDYDQIITEAFNSEGP